ncbi:MAG: glycosyltransferase, partial [Bacteroidota bacterium]
LGMREHMRLFPGVVHWVGFRQTRLPVAHAPRAEGKTSYSFGKLLRLAIRSMLSFSDKPLRLTVRFGLLVSLIAFCYAIYTFFRAWRGEIPVEGWASLIVSVWFFSGVLITTIGLVGLYIGQIFTEVKKRPLYIVDRQLNTSPENSDPVA